MKKLNVVLDWKDDGNDFIDKCLMAFRDAYEEMRGEEYLFVEYGKDREFMGKLVGLYNQAHKGPDGRPTRNQTEALLEMKAFFKAVVVIDDQWLYDNMSPVWVYKKMNFIKSKMKNGNRNSQKRNPNYKPDEEANRKFNEGLSTGSKLLGLD
jgi:hypothetical protein